MYADVAQHLFAVGSSALGLMLFMAVAAVSVHIIAYR